MEPKYLRASSLPAALSFDTAQFLVLAAALAASGCSSSDKTAADGGSGGSAAGGISGSSGGSSSGGSLGTGGGAGGSAGSRGSGGSGGSGGASASGGSAGAKDGGACYGDTGNPGACILGLAVDAGCAWQETYCLSVTEGMKLGVSEAAISCMEGLAGCAGPDAYTCVRTALNGACPDPTSDQVCSTIEGACFGGPHAITHQDCAKLVSGLTAAGRQTVAACVTGSDGGTGCVFDVWTCIEGL